MVVTLAIILVFFITYDHFPTTVDNDSITEMTRYFDRSEIKAILNPRAKQIWHTYGNIYLQGLHKTPIWDFTTKSSSGCRNQHIMFMCNNPLLVSPMMGLKEARSTFYRYGLHTLSCLLCMYQGFSVQCMTTGIESI